MQYLTQWRMLLAANLLCRSNAPLARIAEDVGYQTDTAFSRAFRREYGSPPAAWRRSQALSGSPAATPRADEMSVSADARPRADIFLAVFFRMSTNLASS